MNAPDRERVLQHGRRSSRRVIFGVSPLESTVTIDIRSRLAACLDEPPEDLVALYTETLPHEPRLGIKVRELADAIKYTKAIHDRTLLGRSMGLFALDDANDSNPFCYVTRGPLRGCILHLHHDDDSAIEFSSLSAFIGALRSAVKEASHIDDMSGKELRPKIDQRALADRIAVLLQADTDEAECELTLLTGLLDTSQTELVRQLAGHSSFFVRESVARLVAAYPTAHLVDVAESLANDRHPQVARPGKTALSAAKRTAWNG